MRNPKSLAVKGFLALLIFTGCASFEPSMRLQSLSGPRQPSARASQEGFEVSIEEFISHAKSQAMFDTNLAASRVIGILVRGENNGAEKFSVRSADIRATLDGQPLAQLPAKDAAKQAANSEYVGKALGWTLATGPFAMILWPVTIGASAIHTRGVNEKIEAYFEATGYKDSVVAPKQMTFGFVYFKLEEKRDRIENLVIDVDALGDPSAKKLTYRLTVPPVAVEK